MKKIICLLLILQILICVSACENSKSQNDNTEETVSTVDLTVFSDIMVYSQIYNIITNPTDYLGKIIKLTGNFAFFEDSANGNQYFACLVNDETGCCSLGFEFVLDGNFSYPEDYPSPGTEVTVTGTLETYEEGGYTYYTLTKAQFE